MVRSGAPTTREADQLQQLARVVIARVRLRNTDRADAGDCYQEAYLAGLKAKQSAARSKSSTSARIIMMAMAQAIYRMLHRGRGELLEADFQ
jgi:DNA-directed RNA polymerase specialized sigma24 family protein